ncbi:MAG: hypothetical protein K5765_03200 [Clostridia bacterium]|nr:hypothetical protein [Clostridia bacterium]
MSKYIIRMMPDFMTTCLWSVNKKAIDDFSYEIGYKDLHLSKELTKLLEQFDDDLLWLIDRGDPANKRSRSLEERYMYLEREKHYWKWLEKNLVMISKFKMS